MKLLILTLALLSILSILSTSCSSQKKTGQSNQQIQDKLNHYLKKLEKDETQVLILGSQLIMDFRHHIIAALKTQNSTKALQYSSLAIEHFPFRADLIRLHQESLSAFKESTQSLSEQPSVSCQEINHRVAFLKRVAPDEVIHFKNICTNHPMVNIDSDVNLLDLDLPSLPQPESSAYHFEERLSEYLERSQQLPHFELLVHSLKLLSKFYLKLSDYQIHPDTDSETNVIICPQKTEEFLPEQAVGSLTLIKSKKVDPAYNQYCDSLETLLSVDGASQPITCQIRNGNSFKTSAKIVDYQDVLFNSAWLPKYVVIRDRFKLRDGSLEDHYYLVKARLNKVSGAHNYLINQLSSLSVSSVYSPAKRHYQQSFACQKGLNSQQAKNLISYQRTLAIQPTLQLNGVVWKSFLQNSSRDQIDQIIENWSFHAFANEN